MKKADKLLFVLIVPLIPAGIMGFTGYGWWYFLTVFIFYLCFGVMQLLSKKYRGHSISTDITNTPDALFWWIIGTWTLMHIGITLHWILMR